MRAARSGTAERRRGVGEVGRACSKKGIGIRIQTLILVILVIRPIRPTRPTR